jgi:O-antigen/teichoic acid export membrane protein
MSKRFLYRNTVSSLMNQVVTVLYGLVLPRLILSTYGSEVNGLLSSITQFLGFISLLDLGVGAVIQSAYYKPIAERDSYSINLIYNESKKFFSVISYILIFYVTGLCVFFSKAADKQFDIIYIISLVTSISISLFAQYFFSIPNDLLLNADQHYYYQSNIQIVLTTINIAIGVVLIKLNTSIQIVKLLSSLIYCVKPFILYRYVKTHYQLKKEIKDSDFRIRQKWSGLAQHCATVITNNMDVMVLTCCSTFSQVSVYTVYNMVISGVKLLINSLSNGFFSYLGDLYAREKYSELNEKFDLFEWGISAVVTMIFSITGLLIVPFVANYTSGISDISYIQPLFAVCLTAAQAVYCFRIPYNTMICSAGHYKQTQNSAIVEILINLLISIVFVYRFGLIGVAVGTLLAMLYRTIYFICYLHFNILKRSYLKVVNLMLVNILECALIVLICRRITNVINPFNGFMQWILTGVIFCLISVLLIVIINFIFYKKYLKKGIDYIFTML